MEFLATVVHVSARNALFIFPFTFVMYITTENLFRVITAIISWLVDFVFYMPLNSACHMEKPGIPTISLFTRHVTLTTNDYAMEASINVRVVLVTCFSNIVSKRGNQPIMQKW